MKYSKNKITVKQGQTVQRSEVIDKIGYVYTVQTRKNKESLLCVKEIIICTGKTISNVTITII